MNPVELKPIARQHANSLQFVMKELKSLNDRLINTKPEVNEEKFMSNLVEATFLMNGFTIAQKSFASMVSKEPDPTKQPLEFFKESIDKMLMSKVLDTLSKDVEEMEVSDDN